MSALPKRCFTPEEYLTLEPAAPHKSQFVAGEIYAMAGTEAWHDNIVSNLHGMLHNEFRDRPCKDYTSDMRVRVKAAELYTYPDVSASCGKPIFEAADKPRSLLNPQVIFEVSSPSTEAFDRGDKFARYQQLESLTDYVLVSAERVRVELFTRLRDGSWLYRAYEELDARLTLASVGCKLPLDEIYHKVEFPAAAASSYRESIDVD